MLKKHAESGQALILIVFGIVAILAMVGLATDGAHSFSDRRQAQNAADAAAMAAAIASVSHQNYRDAALYQIHNNGYSNDGVSSQMDVNQPPIDGAYSCASLPTDCQKFIQVKLTSRINTWFAGIVGITTLSNTVSAVARADIRSRIPFYEGAAIVALNPSNCRSLEISGNNFTTLKGSGIFVNSNCNNQPVTNPQKAFYSSGSSKAQAPWIRVVGGAFYTPGNLSLDQPVITGATPVGDIKSEYELPAPTCGAGGVPDPLHPEVAQPGGYADFPPPGVTSMAPGVYCLGNLKVKDHLVGEGVTIVLSGGVQIDGNAYVDLKAKTTGEFAGLLFYMPPSHHLQITINGDSASEFSGLILAPNAHVTINGTGKTGAFITQVVADTVTISGDSALNIQYDESKIYQPYAHPRVELVR